MFNLEKIKLPSKSEVEAQNRYTTYYNYLTSISKYLDPYPDFAQILTTNICDSSKFKAIQKKRNVELSKVEKLLRHAWFTESLMQISGENKDYISYANHWSPVQLYYSMYLALRALLEASCFRVSSTHSKTLNSITEEIVMRPSLFGGLWRTTLHGDVEKGKIEYKNMPSNIAPQRVSPLSANNDFWDSYCMFLRTTRKRQIDEYIQNWKKENNRKRIPQNQRLKLIDKMPPTSFFHAIFRLRIKANYQDVDSSIAGLASLKEAENFHTSILKIGWYTLLNIELLVARRIGKSNYKSAVENFCKADSKNVSNKTVKLRFDHIDSAF